MKRNVNQNKEWFSDSKKKINRPIGRFFNNGTDGRICGPMCKENFTLSDEGQYCNCLPPYTLNVGDPYVPEDDTCGFDAEDSMGIFTLISDSLEACQISD